MNQFSKFFKWTFVILISFNSSYAQTYSGGNGSANNPFLISTKLDLNNLESDSLNWDKNFQQTANITLTPEDFLPSGLFYNNGKLAKPIGTSKTNFTGTYDGMSFIISGLKMNTPNSGYSGLFGFNDFFSTLKNIVLENVNIVSGGGVGALSGNNNGSIMNCTSSGSVSGISSIGGLVGLNNGIIHNSHSSCIVNGKNSTGGLAGDNSSKGSISNSSASGHVSFERNGGGLVGYNLFGSISTSYASGTVKCSINGAGGLVGYNQGTIENTYATGDVTAYSYLGGLVGTSSNSIKNSYSTGKLFFDKIKGGGGGLLGWDNNGRINSCVWDSATSGMHISFGGEPKSTLEMKSQVTFLALSWDFVGETQNGTLDIWTIDKNINNGYPILTWQKDILTSNEKDNIEIDAIYPYPIPTSDKLFLNTSELTDVTILNLNGLIVCKGIASNSIALNIENLPKGIYYCNMKNKTIKIVTK